jgi:hypothetical protein
MNIAFRAVDLLYTGPDLVFHTGPDMAAWSWRKMDASLFSMRDNFLQKNTCRIIFTMTLRANDKVPQGSIPDPDP